MQRLDKNVLAPKGQLKGRTDVNHGLALAHFWVSTLSQTVFVSFPEIQRKTQREQKAPLRRLLLPLRCGGSSGQVSGHPNGHLTKLERHFEGLTIDQEEHCDCISAFYLGFSA